MKSGVDNRVNGTAQPFRSPVLVAVLLVMAAFPAAASAEVAPETPIKPPTLQTCTKYEIVDDESGTPTARCIESTTEELTPRDQPGAELPARRKTLSVSKVPSHSESNGTRDSHLDGSRSNGAEAVQNGVEPELASNRLAATGANGDSIPTSLSIGLVVCVAFLALGFFLVRRRHRTR